MFYKIKLINSVRLTGNSLSNFVNNIAEGIYKIKCKYGQDNKKCEICGIKYKDCDCFVEYTNIKDSIIESKYFYCNQNYQKKLDKKILFCCCEKVFIHMNT